MYMYVHSEMSFDLEQSSYKLYKLDTEAEGTTVYRNPKALGCGNPRVLLGVRGFLQTVALVGQGI